MRRKKDSLTTWRFNDVVVVVVLVVAVVIWDTTTREKLEQILRQDVRN